MKQALEILAPEPHQRSAYERDIAWALQAIAYAVKVNKSLPSPRERRKLLRDQETALKKAIRAAKLEWPENPHIHALCAALQTCRLRYPPKNTRKFSHERMHAVVIARALLERCGKIPTLYRDGEWHELARVLFGNEQADLFDYIENLATPISVGKLDCHVSGSNVAANSSSEDDDVLKSDFE